MEFVHFPTDEDMKAAFRVMMYKTTSPEIYFTFRDRFPHDTCVTTTAAVRALLKHGVRFDWLTKEMPDPPTPNPNRG